MSAAASAPESTLQRHDPPRPARSTSVRQRTLEIEVIVGGDPIRFGRVLSALVNNSPMALAAVTAGERAVYPVPSSVVTRRRPIVLTLRMRDRNQHLDGLLVAEIVSIVSTMCTVVEVWRRP